MAVSDVLSTPRNATYTGLEPGRPARALDRFYRPELDALRFFAFLAVYLNHTLIYPTASGPLWKRALGGIGTAGAFGVDLFFALSAYLITELFLREMDRTGTLDVRAFYVRRILRIWPLYFAFLLAMVIVARLTPTEQMTPAYALGFGLFCGNWLWMAHPIRSMAAPLWSVSVEEQFYLVWPWVVRGGRLRRIVTVSVAILGVALATRLALQLLGIGEPWLSKNSFARADGIGAGALVAVALRGRMPRLSSARRGLLIGGALLGLAIIGTTFGLFTRGVRVLPTTLGGSLAALCCVGLLVAVLGATGRLGVVLHDRRLVYLGRISYGLYVFHQVGLAVADRLIPDTAHHLARWGAHFAVGLAVTMAVAPLSYHFLEQPFLRLKRRFTIVASRPVDDAADQPDALLAPAPVPAAR